MRGKVVAALAALAVFFGGSVWLVAWLTRGGSPLAVNDQPPPGPPPALDEPVGPQARPVTPMAPGASVAAPAPVDALLPTPPRDSWAAVKAIARPGALGALGREITGGLDDLQPRLQRCADAEVQARHGTLPVSGLDGADENSPPALMLQLETLEGEVKIVDAPVENRGKADDGLFACAQKVLRGQVLPAPSARRGQRIRLMFPLPQ